MLNIYIYVAIVGGMMSSTAVSALNFPLYVEQSNVQSTFDLLLKEIPEYHFFSAANMRKLLQKYSNDELALIYKDFIDIHEQTFSHATKQLDYVVTAGGPASGKSTLLENILENKNIIPDDSHEKIQRAYIDPDKTCLLKMERTYKKDISLGIRDPQNAYEHWREASNFLANYYLAIALKEGYAIAHGSTMASPFAKNALATIRNHYGYTTTIIHVTCEEEIRDTSEKKRQEGGVIQCTKKDFQEKQALFFTLLGDYIYTANKVIFSYRQSMESTVWAAKIENNQLHIYNEIALTAIQKLHDSIVGEGFWIKTIEGLRK